MYRKLNLDRQRKKIEHSGSEYILAIVYLIQRRKMNIQVEDMFIKNFKKRQIPI